MECQGCDAFDWRQMGEHSGVGRNLTECQGEILTMCQMENQGCDVSEYQGCDAL